MKRNLTLIAVAAVTTFSAASSHASCMDPRTSASAQIPIPMPPRTNTSSANGENASKNIVGTWLVTYTFGGAPAGQAYIQWHSDGTEWENINHPIEGGSTQTASFPGISTRPKRPRSVATGPTGGSLTSRATTSTATCRWSSPGRRQRFSSPREWGVSLVKVFRRRRQPAVQTQGPRQSAQTHPAQPS
jgi:hypothetical protein